VNGVWNNYEGLPQNYNNTIFQVLGRNGYAVHLSGKEDYMAGGHSMDARLPAWTMYTRFPYDIPHHQAWMDEDKVCRLNGRVESTNGTESNYWSGDGKAVNNTIQWIQKQIRQHPTKPFFVYQGINIVYPAYVANERYFRAIDPLKIRVPSWPALEHLHPCDLQSTMLKGCLPLAANETSAFYSVARRRCIRRIYHAMIAEFDAMVGRYMEAIKDEGGLWENTVFVVTSDHGDMQLEHQQHYKQVPYDPSSSVPLIIYDPRTMKPPNHVIETPTQHIDIFPTILTLAGVPDTPPNLDRYSLLPLFTRHGP
jgi:arylsulfatase A-like enzyme